MEGSLEAGGGVHATGEIPGGRSSALSLSLSLSLSPSLSCLSLSPFPSLPIDSSPQADSDWRRRLTQTGAAG